MPAKHEPTLLTDVAKKIGSTLGVVAAEASKVVRPLRMKASRVVTRRKPRGHGIGRSRTARPSGHPMVQKRDVRRRRTPRSSKPGTRRH